MKLLFDIDGKYYELELSKGETKQLEYKEGRFAKVSIHQICKEPTENSIGSAYLRVEFDNGNVWHSKDAVIAKKRKDKTMKLYLINQYEAYQAAEQGVTAVRELPNETAYYKHEVLAESDVDLPEGFEVAKTNGGGTEIFFGNEGVDMITERKGNHYVTSLVTSQGITAIKKWDC